MGEEICSPKDHLIERVFVNSYSNPNLKTLMIGNKNPCYILYFLPYIHANYDYVNIYLIVKLTLTTIIKPLTLCLVCNKKKKMHYAFFEVNDL